MKEDQTSDTKRTPVNSDMLSSVGYDAATETLEVEFKNKTVYTYFGVPKDVFDALMKAESQGKYFSAHIKDLFPFEKHAPS